jgi:hypothetical protein
MTLFNSEYRAKPRDCSLTATRNSVSAPASRHIRPSFVACRPPRILSPVSAVLGSSVSCSRHTAAPISNCLANSTTTTRSGRCQTWRRTESTWPRPWPRMGTRRPPRTMVPGKTWRLRARICSVNSARHLQFIAIGEQPPTP